MLTQKQKDELMRIPLMKEIKKNYMTAQSGGGRKKRLKGRGWWDDVTPGVRLDGQDKWDILEKRLVDEPGDIIV